MSKHEEEFWKLNQVAADTLREVYRLFKTTRSTNGVTRLAIYLFIERRRGNWFRYSSSITTNRPLLIEYSYVSLHTIPQKALMKYKFNTMQLRAAEQIMFEQK
jgi:hypothetical protein